MTPKAQHLTQLVIDVEEQTITATYSLPQDGGYLEYTGTLSLHPDEASPLLVGDARLLVEQVTGELASGRWRQDCDTCTGNCCKTFDVVEVTPMDIHRMTKAGLDVESLVTKYAVLTVTGVAGQLKQKKTKRCLSLDKHGRCRIYEHRPQACRDFSAVDCRIYEVDEKKKTRLKVVS